MDAGRRAAVTAAARLLRAEVEYRTAQAARDAERYAAALDELREAESEAQRLLRTFAVAQGSAFQSSSTPSTYLAFSEPMPQPSGQ